MVLGVQEGTWLLVNYPPSMFVIIFEKAPFAKAALFAMVNQNNKCAPYIGVVCNSLAIMV